MKSELIGYGQLFKETWELAKKNLWLFLLIGVGGQLIISLIGLTLVGKVASISTNDPTVLLSLTNLAFAGLVAFLISLVIGSLVSASLVILTIKSQKGEKTVFQAVLSEAFSIFVKFLIVQTLVGLIVLIGFILLIIPGIIFSVWYFAASYVLVEQKITGFDALKESKRLVEGYVWDIILRFLAGLLVIICIGFVVSIAFFPFDPHGKSLAVSLIRNLINGGFSTAGVVYGYVIYRSLKQIKSSAK